MDRSEDRIIRGGNRQNSDVIYLTTAFQTDFPSDQRSLMGFRTFRPCRVLPVGGSLRA